MPSRYIEEDQGGRNLSRHIRSAKGLALAALAVTLLAGGACDRKPKEGTAASPPPSVVVATVEQRTVPIVRDFVTRTEAIPTVEVRARVPGVLEQVLYKEGT
jgi:membrane fusion protein (multidrug efflux system)